MEIGSHYFGLDVLTSLICRFRYIVFLTPLKIYSNILKFAHTISMYEVLRS